MRVRDAMSTEILTVGPQHKLRQVARLMSARRFGAAVVIDPDSPGIGILTERDVLNAISSGLDPDIEEASDHRTPDAVTAGPDWDLDQAAATMIRGGFRHLIVIEGDEVIGMISVRDIVRARVQATAKV
ncbi:CBS domain-containing protein [Longispora albida]|uniref:CBS domain-containing protein n=1 Tax=Longispora albida TaxID=203523 RepID=UPI0003A18506|nr:CBS domain-containing protein [Longispora albida]